jgi:SAM-dependent methyltransferase
LYGADFFVGRRETVLASANVVAPLVADLVAPLSVLDVGCGYGEWMEAFSAAGADVLGVDIAAPEGDLFIRHDLTVPLDLGRTFDLVVSLEVAEHLPADAADTLVDSLARHGETILFSGAVPGQEGKGHINCQPHGYWHAKFADRGFAMSDPVRPLVAGDHRVSPWYRDNIFVYERQL